MRVRIEGFTLIETLTVAAVIGLLAGLLLPALSASREAARKSACLASLRQIGVAMALYTDDNGGVLPDRRDLKHSLEGGFRPWSGWPPSDPRCGWAAVLLAPYGARESVWTCPSVRGTALGENVRVLQRYGDGRTAYWMWRFDRYEDPVPLDNLWGKTVEQAVRDLAAARSPFVGIPEGPADVELAVDPYFPRTARDVPAELGGRAVHFGGRNRLFLDGHARYIRDGRTE